MSKLPKENAILPAEAALLTELEEGRSYQDVAKAAGIPAEEVRLRVVKILNRVDKIELLRRFPQVYVQSQGVEGLDPAKDVIKMSKEIGMSKAMTEGLRRRIMARQGMQPTDPRALTDKTLVHTLKEKLALALEYLDPYVLAGSSAKDLDAVIDGLIKNIQLLEGKPTSITSHEDRRQMNELIPALLLEAQKRGLKLPIDVVPERLPPVTVVPEEK